MKSWKYLELNTAKSLGVCRTPLSGGSGAFTKGDVMHEKLYIECKYRIRFSIMAYYLHTRTMAIKENKQPVLCLKEKARHGELAVIDWQLFLQLWRSYEQTKKDL